MRLSYSLSKYLFKTFLKWSLVTSLVFTAIYILFDVIELLRRVSSLDSIPNFFILKMVMYRFPMFFQEILPFILFFASIITFWQLNRNSEILSIRAAGVSIWQILLPLVSGTLLLGLVDLLIVNSFSSVLMGKYYNLERTYIYKSSAPFSISKSGLWLRETIEGKQIIMNAKRYDDKNEVFHKFTAYVFDKNDQFLERFGSQKAILRDQKLHLKKGWHIENGGFPESFKDKVMPTGFSKKNIKASFSDPKTLNFYTLRSYANLMETSGLSSTPYYMQWHILLSRCFWLSIMVLLAATFSLSQTRNGKGSIMIISGVAFTFLLYFLKDVTFSLGGAGKFPPFLAAWVPVIVTAFFAATRLLYSEDG